MGQCILWQICNCWCYDGKNFIDNVELHHLFGLIWLGSKTKRFRLCVNMHFDVLSSNTTWAICKNQWQLDSKQAEKHFSMFRKFLVTTNQYINHMSWLLWYWLLWYWFYALISSINAIFLMLMTIKSGSIWYDKTLIWVELVDFCLMKVENWF